jgi:ParB-like chromosome segregation protein Spo0J
MFLLLGTLSRFWGIVRMLFEFQINTSQKYASLVPELSPQEYESLRQSIKENGLYFPIVVNQNGTILDGHHRNRACKELGIIPKISIRESKDKQDEWLFIINSNLKRRQLNSFQRTKVALKSKPILTEIARNNMSAGGKGSKSLEALDEKGVIGEVAKLAGVSHETVRKVEKIIGSGIMTEELEERLRLGEVSIDRAHKMIAVREREKKREQNQTCQGAANESVSAYDPITSRIGNSFLNPKGLYYDIISDSVNEMKLKISVSDMFKAIALLSSKRIRHAILVLNKKENGIKLVAYQPGKQ